MVFAAWGCWCPQGGLQPCAGVRRAGSTSPVCANVPPLHPHEGLSWISLQRHESCMGEGRTTALSISLPWFAWKEACSWPPGWSLCWPSSWEAALCTASAASPREGSICALMTCTELKQCLNPSSSTSQRLVMKLQACPWQKLPVSKLFSVCFAVLCPCFGDSVSSHLFSWAPAAVSEQERRGPSLCCRNQEESCCSMKQQQLQSRDPGQVS